MADTKYLTVPHLNRKKLRRLFDKIAVDPISGCWLWTAACSNKGYAVTNLGSDLVPTHRLMFAWLVAPVPRGIGREIPQLDHLCRVRRCCNPAHLELVSIRTNLLRGTGTSAENARKTTCPLGHPLEARKDGAGRFCRQCSINASLASYYGGRRTVRPRRHKGSDTAA